MKASACVMDREETHIRADAHICATACVSGRAAGGMHVNVAHGLLVDLLGGSLVAQ